MKTYNRKRFREAPIIVVGSGIAGLLLSIELADAGCDVLLVTRTRLEESNTAWAQGGLAAVTELNSADTKEQHMADTIAAGDGLTNEVVADRIISDGARLVHRLADHGVRFDISSLALEGGHRMARVLHSADATGRAIVDALITCVKKRKRIEVKENCLLKEIVIEDGRAIGIKASTRNEVCQFVIKGSLVVLATGGLGQIFSRTTNPSIATGDGIAAAYRAGADLVDLEFVQFHPTALHLPGAPAFLISEAARGAGATLLNRNGQRFVHKHHPSGELATRDVVSRAIFSEMQENGSDCVWLDMRPIGEEKLKVQFPNIVSKLKTYGINPLCEPVPVSPSAHYFMGGILADEYGRTTRAGLFAIGECASTGLHGANRLASNSLLEGGVMALKLASLLTRASDHEISTPLSIPNRNAQTRFGCHDSVTITMLPLNRSKDFRITGGAQISTEITDIRHGSFRSDMFETAGLVRNHSSLAALIEKYGSAPHMVPHSLGLLIATAALLRKESRGAHWRSDYPARNDRQFSAHLAIGLDGFYWIPLATESALASNEAVSTARS